MSAGTAPRTESGLPAGRPTEGDLGSKKERRIGRKSIIVMLALAGIVVGVLVGTGGGAGESAPGPGATVAVAAKPPGGDAVAPMQHERKYIFGQLQPPAQIRDSSLRLLEVIEDHQRLSAVALESTLDTSAVILIEQSPSRPWGELATPAQREMFRAFAEDPSLGRWLIVLVDIEVYGLFDPVPLTAYRWDRDAVEAYATCGIPATGLPQDGLDACSLDFYRAADVVSFRFGPGRPGPNA